MSEFRNRGVIVTGAGSGIGLATALRFADLGAKVLIAEINPARAEAAVNEISAKGGVAQAVVGDLSDQAVVEEVIATAVRSFGGFDVLVNNAGIMDSMTATADVSDAEWERVIRINLTAPFLLTRAALTHLLARGGGVIVNTAYTVSKHGLVGLTKSTAIMYRDRGIRVNVVAPGFTQTNVMDNISVNNDGATTVGRYRGNVGRGASPDELAAAIVFLRVASGASSGVAWFQDLVFDDGRLVESGPAGCGVAAVEVSAGSSHRTSHRAKRAIPHRLRTISSVRLTSDGCPIKAIAVRPGATPGVPFGFQRGICE